MAFGGKFGIDYDTETPNTLTAGFSYGDQQLVVEVRGRMTNGEGVRQARVVTAGPTSAPAGGENIGAPPPTQAGQPSYPLNVGVGNLFYGSDGWAAMSDEGFQAYKGDSSQLIMKSGQSVKTAIQRASTCRISWHVSNHARRKIFMIRLPTRCPAPIFAILRILATASAAR